MCPFGVPGANKLGSVLTGLDAVQCSRRFRWMPQPVPEQRQSLALGETYRQMFKSLSTLTSECGRDFCPSKPTVTVPESWLGTCVSALATFCEGIPDHTNPEAQWFPACTLGAKSARLLLWCTSSFWQGWRCLLTYGKYFLTDTKWSHKY